MNQLFSLDNNLRKFVCSVGWESVLPPVKTHYLVKNVCLLYVHIHEILSNDELFGDNQNFLCRFSLSRDTLHSCWELCLYHRNYLQCLSVNRRRTSFSQGCAVFIRVNLRCAVDIFSTIVVHSKIVLLAQFIFVERVCDIRFKLLFFQAKSKMILSGWCVLRLE